jgi:pimeloyl-ACP methyl ester carboxylesterase
MITREPLAYRAPLNTDQIGTPANQTPTGLAEPPASPSLNSVRHGSGEPMLLLHSLGGSLVQWSPVLDRLARDRELIAVDMPGFGDSRPLPDGIEPSAANLASAVLEFYDSLALGSKPHVAGISLGGWAAIECARQGQARSVVGLCTAGFWRKALPASGDRLNRARAAGRALRPVLRATMWTARGRRRALHRFVHYPERLSPREAAIMARAYVTSPAYPKANALMRDNRIETLEDIRVPITLAWAEYDRIVRNRPLDEDRLPKGVRQVELPGCGHVPTWDDPDLVARVILEGTGGA